MKRGSALRICHLGKYYPPAPGGIETHVRTLARAQAALGADVQVACVNHQDHKGRDVTWVRRGATPTVVENDGGVRVTRLGRSAHFAKLDVVPGLRNFFHSFKRNPVDVIHLHTPNPTMLLAVAAMRPAAPLVITHHSDVVKQRFLYQAFRGFEGVVYRRARCILSDSAAYIGGSERLLQHQAKVEALPLGLDLDPFISPRPAAMRYAAELRAQHGSPLWLSVGRCVYYKGFHVAIRALRDVPGKLMIVGQGPYKEHLIEAARDMGVMDRIVWVDYMDEDQLAGAYHAATAFWFPSNARSEGFGLVQVEAMASGCPVINTAIPHSGVSWVSPHDESGLTVPPDDPQQFAAAANRLIAEPDLRQRLGESARRRARVTFDHATMANDCLVLYDRMLSSVPVTHRREMREASAAPAPSGALDDDPQPHAIDPVDAYNDPETVLSA